MALHHVLDGLSSDVLARTAVIEGDDGSALSYDRLISLAGRLRDRLVAAGVVPGDRVGLYLPKSTDAVAAIFGVLQAGAAYVPVDPTAPPARNAYIHQNCGARVVIVTRRLEPAYRAELARLGAEPVVLVIEETGGGKGLLALLDALDRDTPAPEVPSVNAGPADLAYVLYTSGSTGVPKGVMLSHGNAVAFVDWCSEEFQPAVEDVFSSHAPFHFDLSILDIYVPLKHGATLVLVPERIGKEPRGLAEFIARHRITCWYSAPSTLSLLAQCDRLKEFDYSPLRYVLFAGEVFPVVHLRSLTRQWPAARYFNLYGPTETNVCTSYEVPLPVPEQRTEPYPIGAVCRHLHGRVVDPEGRDVTPGHEGELCIAGANVMVGYWGSPDLTRGAFLGDEEVDGSRWYRTGDLVVDEGHGIYRYVGRRDRMVKKRGYRVELGEIEACLYRHPLVREVAVVALADEAAGIHVRAHLSVAGDRRPSLIELKTFCSAHLPAYMIPDSFGFHDALRRTSTDKVDYRWLEGLGTAGKG